MAVSTADTPKLADKSIQNINIKDMPYKIVKKGNKFLTVNKDTSKVKGTHDSKEKAIAQMRLLYGVEGGMKVKGKSQTSKATATHMVKHKKKMMTDEGGYMMS